LGGADAAFVQAFRSLRPGGRLVLVGLPADNEMRLPIFETVPNGIQIIGSIVGTRVDLAEVFELHARGRTQCHLPAAPAGISQPVLH
jgi:propanol-preferring alcohol dehydrogenase